MKVDARALVIALIVILVGGLGILRQRVTRSSSSVADETSSPAEEEVFEEDYVRQRVARPPRTDIMFASRQRAPAPTKIVKLSEGELGDSFEAEKYRAFGDAAVFGMVRGPDRRPLAGARVELYDPDPMTKNPPLRECVSDTSGTFRLEKINASERLYILLARAEGCAPVAEYILLRDEATERNISLSAGVECAGVVVDALTSLPLGQATVYHPVRGGICFRPLGVVDTSPMGEFRFPSVAQGTVKVLVECPGYRSAQVTLTTPITNAVIALVPGGGTIRGETISRLTDKPEPRVKVALLSEALITTTLSDDEGRFVFENLPAGKFTLIGVKNGMPGLAETVTLSERETREGVRIIVPASLLVSGRVVHALSGEPLAGIHLYYPSPRGKALVLSDENGLFGFETLTVDSYWIEVHEKGYLPLLERRTTGVVERIERRIKRSDASDQVTIRLRPVPSIEGVVKATDRSGRAGAPVAAIDVAVAYEQRRTRERVATRTNALGKFFVNLPSGRRGSAKIVANHRGAIGVRSVRIPTRQPVEIVLQRERMNGQLFLSDGTPLAGVEIRSRYLFPDRGRPEERLRLDGAVAYVRASGSFSLALAPQQQVELLFSLPDGASIVKSFPTSELLSGSHTFVYDPLARDVLHDARRRHR